MPIGKAYVAPVKWIRKRAPRLIEEVGPIKSTLQSTAAQKLYDKSHTERKKVAMLLEPLAISDRFGLIKEAINKKKLQQHTRRRLEMKGPPKDTYEGPVDYVRRLFGEDKKSTGGAPTVRARARAAGKKQPYTVRARVAREAEAGPKVSPAQPKVHTNPKPGVVSPASKTVSKLRRYGVPAAAILGTAAIGGGLAYAHHRNKKKTKEYEDKFFKKTAMFRGFFDEIEKMSQAPTPPPAPSPGMGAPSPGAAAAPGADPLGSGSATLPPPVDPANSISSRKAGLNV